MSETKTPPPTEFGRPETRKKVTVFGIPVKVDPYTSIRPDKPGGEYVIAPNQPKQEERPPNSLVVEPYPGHGK
jgi:hypothetical protein